VIAILAVLGNFSSNSSQSPDFGNPTFDYGEPAQVYATTQPVPMVFPTDDPLVIGGTLGHARSNHTATLLPDGKVVVAGGINPTTSSASTLASIEIYDPTTRTFSPGGAMLTPRSDQTATLLPDGRVLFAGGRDQTGAVLASAEVYDPTTSTSQATAPMIDARTSAAAVALDDGRVFIVGGSDGVNPRSSAEVYDSRKESFSSAGSLPDGSGFVTAVKLEDGGVLIAGGDAIGGSLSTAQVYDPTSGDFTVVAGMQTARTGATSCLLPDGTVLVVGGFDSSGMANSTAEIYYPGKQAFVFGVVQLGSPRWRNTTTLLSDGSVLLVGGVDNAGNEIDTVERYYPENGAMDVSTPVGTMQLGRSSQTATALPDGSVLIVGGSNGTVAISDFDFYKPD